MAASGALPGHGEVILVVEDDDTLRNAVARMLNSLGFSVHTAAGGLEALGVVERGNVKIDVLLTDVVMRDLDGPGLVARLSGRGIRPGVIYMSGYADPAVLARVPSSATTPLLIKPFTLHALVRVVREILDHRKGL